MIFLELFYTFLLIGAFTFGGGYSMIALIENEVVNHHGWMTLEEFTDLVAISQMTPGPVGINTATYAGYSAVISSGYSAPAAVAGSLIASGAVMLIPIVLVMIVGRWLLAHLDQPMVATVMRCLRLAVVVLIAAAALILVPTSFTAPDGAVSPVSIAIFLEVFYLSWRRKANPILLILASGLIGLLLYA